MLKLNTTPKLIMPYTTDYKSKGLDFNLGQGVSNSLTKDMYHALTNSNSIKVSNKYNFKKTTNDISFSGLSISNVQQIKNSNIWKLFNANWFKKFIATADSSQTIFDAIFALGITCILRPAAIMMQSSEKTREKSKKAASHSISSGIIGYGFAVALFSPIKTALNKLKKNPEIFAKKAEKFLSNTKNAQTFTMLLNKSTEVLTASFRSAVTIALIPIIDKYVLNKIFSSKSTNETKNDLQNPIYRYSYINFKNNMSTNKVFQNFTGAIK